LSKIASAFPDAITKAWLHGNLSSVIETLVKSGDSQRVTLASRVVADWISNYAHNDEKNHSSFSDSPFKHESFQTFVSTLILQHIGQGNTEL